MPGYTGADCSVVEGHPPGLLALLPSNVCDIQTKPCQKIRLHVSGIMDSESLTCRVKKLKVWVLNILNIWYDNSYSNPDKL